MGTLMDARNVKVDCIGFWERIFVLKLAQMWEGLTVGLLMNAPVLIILIMTVVQTLAFCAALSLDIFVIHVQTVNA